MKRFLRIKHLEWHQLPVGTVLLFLLLLAAQSVVAQCTNTTLFPATAVTVSSFNDTVVVSNNSNAGQYYQVKNLALNKSYVFTAKAGDFITIRNPYTNAVLGSGPAPYTYAAGSGPDAVNVHINLVSPACGTDATARTTAVVCTNCTTVGSKTGVNQPNPQAMLDVGGEIKLGNANRTPQAGMVRWNPATSDFEGYNGTLWLSLTKAYAGSGQWGQVSTTTIQENNKVTASDGAADDKFGYAVSISGDYAIIGASGDDNGANANQGSAYIFARIGNSWTQQAKLTAADGAAGDQFGISVAINGDFAVVGANFDTVGANARQGSAYVFVRNGSGWIQQAKLTAADGAAFDNFGISVAISGDYAVVGAYLDDVGGWPDRGSAYVFVRTGSSWSQQSRLTGESGEFSGINFGNSVAISGDYVIVGSDNDNNLPRYAYVFVRSGTSWAQQAGLQIEYDNKVFQMGFSVSISGSYAIVGYPTLDIDNKPNQGQAYIFIRNGTTWSQHAVLRAKDGAANAFFGNSVSLSGDIAIVGAYNTTVGSRTIGASYIFVRNGTSWGQQSKLITSDGAAGANVGLSVSISGDNAIVGASGNDIGSNTDQGSVYFIRKN